MLVSSASSSAGENAKCSVSEITSGFWKPYRLQKQLIPPRQTGEAIAVRSTKHRATTARRERHPSPNNRLQATDHDFQPLAPVTPVGIFLSTLEERFGYGVTSQVTSDGLVARLTQWWEAVRARCTPIPTLVLKADNGPENHSRRTQCMQRLVQLVQQYRVTVRQAYSPPSHSKYNPIERCWGILENHGNEALLDSMDTVLQ
jgi:hypothetical protein